MSYLDKNLGYKTTKKSKGITICNSSSALFLDREQKGKLEKSTCSNCR
jgi:hypothetical protein